LLHCGGHGVPEVGRTDAFCVRNHDGRDMIADMTRPLIGISIDNVLNNIDSGRYESNVNYSLAVAKAGGLPVLLPQEMELVHLYVECLDGLLLTGGDDAHTEHFGDPAHPLSRCIEPGRQKFELALLETLMAFPQRPVLGVCLGMQIMALHAGGRLNQHLPDTLANAVEIHQNDRPHPVIVTTTDSAILGGWDREAGQQPDLSCQSVVSSHHQAVMDAGRLRVIAHSIDGVIEAIDDPIRPFYVGVQWHPERGGNGFLNLDLIKRFVDASTRQRSCLPKLVD
jgi:putative glutamine amidotransferase